MDDDATTQEQQATTDFPDLASRPARASHAGDLARVYELSEARRRRMTGSEQIPEEVWDAMGRAQELADDLAALGQQVRFDSHQLSGRIVASLCDADGGVLRRIGLRDVLSVDPDPDSAA